MAELKKLAITGANGYLGKYTIKTAIKSGWNVIGIVRREDAAKEVESIGAKAVIIKEFNVESLKKAIIDCNAIIHFRGVVCGPKEIFEKINVEGMRVVVKAAEEAKVSRIVFPSGLGVDRYDEAEWAKNEYFRSKMIAEQILKEGSIPYIIFRPSYILGPNDELIPDIIEQIGSGNVSIAGSGEISMQPIFVEDATRAFLAAADGIGENNQIYDLVGPRIINMRELIDMTFKIMVEMGFNLPPPRLKSIPYKLAPDELGLCKEMIDVMRCDITSDGTIVANALGFNLTDINKAIRAAIVAKLLPEAQKEKKKAIVLLSGGIDSATTLYWAHRKGYDLIPISFNYHLRPENEKKAALKLTESLGVKLIKVPTEYLKETIDLRIKGLPIPSAINAPEGFIPARNLVFYSIAAYYAEVYGCNFIIGGHIAADPVKFPDADEHFFKSLEELIKKGKHHKDESVIEIILPLIKMTKIDVIKLAKKLNVPFNWTWSCYSDGDKPCGRCSSCLKRKEAFSALGYSDPEFFL